MLEPLHFEKGLGAVICRRCEAGVVTDSINSINNHFRSSPHHLSGAALKEVQARIKTWPVRFSDEILSTEIEDQPVRAIPHLKIHRGWECKHCRRRLGTDLVNSKTHLRRAHGIHRGAVGPDLEACSLQTVFREKRRVRWFRVREREVAGAAENSDATDSVPAGVAAFVGSQRRVLEKIEEEETLQASKVHDGKDHRSSDIPWIRSCGFGKHLQGLDRKEIRRSWRKPGEHEVDGELVQRVALAAKELLEETWQWCVDGPRCRLTRPMAVILSQFWTEATIHARGFRAGIGTDTRARYLGLWTGLIICYSRVSRGQALTRERDEAAEREDEGEGEGEGEGEQTGSETEAEDEDEDEDADSDSSNPGTALFTGTSEQREAFDECLEAAADRDDVRLSLSVQKWGLAMIRHDLPGYRFESPVLSYCAMLAVNHSSLGWKRPGDFNSSLSGMIYCAQLWIFREACRLVDNSPEHRHLDEMLTQLCQRWMRQERSTTYGIILNWRLMLFSVAKREVSSKNATWSLDGSEVCYQGTTITMEQITQLYRRTLQRARLIMDRDLLLGADHLPRMCATALHEGEHRQEIGWWFAQDPRNAAVLAGRETRLIEHIKSIPAVRAMFLDENDEWRPSAMRLYEHHVQEELGCLFVLFQILPPLRGPECMSVTFRNTEKMRSAMLKHGRLMFYTTYHKGQAQWGTYKENVRFNTVAFDNLVLDLLIYVQPLRKLFLWLQHGKLLPPQLWTKDGRVWDEKILTRVLRKACALAEVPALSESHLRQIWASIVKMKFGADRGCFAALMDKHVEGEEKDDDNDDDGEDETAVTMARMFNHTVRTHNRAYANETSLVGANIWDGLIKRSYRACMLWSQFFRFEEPEEGQQTGLKRERVEADEGQGILKKIALSVPKKHWSGPALLQEARRVYRKPRLQWTCPEQEQAMYAIVAGTMEVLVVMATGKGKSLLFQLPCGLSGAGTTVLIIPLVALRLDLVRRCRELGIDCQEWSVDHGSRAALVFFSVEAAASEEGRAYLYRLHHEKRLDRIILDECHLILIASGYRRAMGQLALLRSIPVQFVYLTATLPPSITGILFKRHYLTQVYQIRAPTRRVNLEYRVHRLQPHQQDVVKEAGSLMRDLWQKRFPREHGAHRALLFARTRAEADRLADILGCSSYHSEAGGVPDKARLIYSWASGTGSPFLVGTSGLGTGLDYSHARMVMHVDEPYGLMEFCQESGRGGRDGEAAESVVILRHGWKPRARQESEANETELHRFLNDSGCRRVAIDRYMDGMDPPDACGPQDAACDNCSRGLRMEYRPAVPVSKTDPIAAGPKVLLQQAQKEAQETGTYRDNLEAVKGQCMICRIRGLDEWQHKFSQCRQVHKWRYINAKKEVLRRSGGQWVARYQACFHCFQPQTLCERMQRGECNYEDLVMQAVFGQFETHEKGDWWRQRFGVRFKTVEDCLLWAGGSGELGGMKCVRGVVVLSRILAEWK